jgi:hypothetical protein
MAEIFKWGQIAFYVKPSGIRGVQDIQITAGCETEDSVVDNEKFVKTKNADKYKVKLTAVLNQALGEDVQDTAMRITEMARNSEQGYLYAAGGKLLPFPFMLTGADVGGLEISPSGQWQHCEVKMDLTQCAKYDGTTTTGSGNGGGDDQPSKKSTKNIDPKKAYQDATKNDPILAAIKAKAAAAEQSKKMLEEREKARKNMSPTGMVATNGVYSIWRDPILPNIQK